MKVPRRLGSKRPLAKPRPRPTPGTMNKTEKAYQDDVLAMRHLSGVSLFFGFEPFKLRLAGNTFYTPDFVEVLPDRIRVIEVKGHWEDDARVKIKVAAEAFWWFEFVAVTKRAKKDGGGWKEETFNQVNQENA